MSTSHAYDDLVVGAGSAGAPLAARLSEDENRQVLLIESGPYYPTVAGTPRDLLDGNRMSVVDHDWGFVADALDGRKIRFPQGRVAGGSSAVGNTVALRGMPGDYDEWASSGNPEWSWDQVLPYFRKIEDDLDFDGEFHGHGGPIPIRRWRPDELTSVQQTFYDACLDAGFPNAADHNDPESTGVGPIPSNRRDPETRVSTAMAYLTPARIRPNLTVRSGCTVNRLLLQGERAVGVEVTTGEKTTAQIRARRVILAAGAIGSPTILLRSGIGPADEIWRHGIELRLDLAGVGANLIDQPRTGVFMVPKPEADHRGKSTGQIVLRTSAAGSTTANDMYYAMVNHFDLTHQFPELRSLAGATNVFGVMAVARRPCARGRVTLTSADPQAAPRINLNYLAAEADYQLFIAGIRTCWELAHSAKIRDQGEHVVVLEESSLGSEDALRTYVRLSVDSIYCPVGTARMGPSTDSGAVVDQRCAVHGIEGLYVADASVLPTMVRANTNLTSIVIGERVADWLRSN